MKVLIENEAYPISFLESIFDDHRFYNQNGNEGVTISVGYYHSFKKNSLVFILPKVFMKDKNNTVFGCNKFELINIVEAESIKHKNQFNWVRLLSIYFYNSLNEFKRKYPESSLIQYSEAFELNSSHGKKEYSYLDIILSFVNFYQKNKQQVFFKYIDSISIQAKKAKWEKTIRKSNPLIINYQTPIYSQIINKKKKENKEELLFSYFLSILNHFDKEHNLNLKIDKNFKLFKGAEFERLCITGSSLLRKIKYRYFNDTLKKMYVLCDLYFTKNDLGNVRQRNEDFLMIKNYNIVFEDMIDKLFSDKLDILEAEGVTIEGLKNNDDGKIIDHIYDYKSLIDTSNIFYIGDSKYYKSDNLAGKVSKYKQFTYAKNVIQFNINLLNDNDQIPVGNIRYRDYLTEGYNISPNFFLYGYIDDILNYSDHSILKIERPISTYHFKDRLFDRDTLFVHQYKINFLFVLKSYTTINYTSINKFRSEVKEKFKDHFSSFFNDSEACGFEIYESDFSINEYQPFIESNFKLLNGKCFVTNDERLLLAVHNSDNSLKNSKIMEHFNRINLTVNQKI
jgi:hypothetical protein